MKNAAADSRALGSYQVGQAVLVQGWGLGFVRAHTRALDGRPGLAIELPNTCEPWLAVHDPAQVGPWPPKGLRTQRRLMANVDSSGQR